MPKINLKGEIIVHRTLLFALTLILVACQSPYDPDAPSEKTLQSLLTEHATRSRVEKVLGRGYTWYEKGTPTWKAFQSDTSDPERVRQAGKKYPKLMFYTTIWQRTWIFLDHQDVMQAYFISSQ